MKNIILILALYALCSCTKRDSYDLQLVCKQSDGLKEKAAVEINGYQIGTVTRLKLDDEYQVMATLSIKNENSIPSQSTFSIENSNLFGAKIVNIRPGEGDFLTDKDTVYEADNSLELFVKDIVSTAMDNLPELIEDINPDSLSIKIETLNEVLEEVIENQE